MDQVRTRFAPSPTGFMHIGNLRTALYEYLIAKSNHGTFLLRIEDTDQERYVEGALDAVFQTLKLTGIQYDEGPGVGGEYGPYIQSERRHIYKQYALQLVESGHAYYCFCTKERLDSLKSDSGALGTGFNYDRHCRTLTPEEIQENLRNGLPYVIRQKMPTDGVTAFTDAVYGEITVENKTLDDQVLLKSDGLPTYNFANVVDDHLMKITHVVRGNEYLSSTPKYNLLYQAFGWEVPVYIHLPPVMKDAHNKLSKRHGDASFQDLLAKGYLPAAILNYIALLGWSPGGNQEFYTLSELEKVFSIDGLSKSPAIFDIEKLKWMNGEYIRRLSPESFLSMALPWLKQTEHLGGQTFTEKEYGKMAALIQPRTELLTEIPEKTAFFRRLPDYDISLYRHKKMKTDTENSLENLKQARDFLQQYDDRQNNGQAWTSACLYEGLCGLAGTLGVKNSQILWPIRTALSGLEVSPGGATELAEILGKEETLRRMDIGISKLTEERTNES